LELQEMIITREHATLVGRGLAGPSHGIFKSLALKRFAWRRLALPS
jgi:hypothetical protein